MKSIALVLLVVCAWPAAEAGAQQRKIQLAPCRLDGWTSDVLCGSYEVYENRRAKTGRKIALKIVVLPATGPSPAPDPVFYFAGGPGGSATETVARAGESYLAALRRDRDLVFVDQRGTGGSNRLDCSLYGDRDDMNGFMRGAFSDDAVRACRDALGRVADLRFYSTPIAIEDLDEVRDALGYETINLYGGSYGSTAAMAYLRQYPKRVRTATLLGVAPPDVHLPLPFAKGVQNAIDHIAADCAADARCHAAYPDPKADLAAAIARLDKGPATVEAVNPITGKSQTVTLTRAGFVDAVRIMLYLPEASRWLPLLLHRSAAGDFGAFVTVSFQTYRAIDDMISRGMHLSVLCGEDLPFVTDADVEREMAGSLYGVGRLAAYRRACENWPRADVPASYATPVTSNAPVLLVVGEADPVTPPWIAEAAARHLPNGRVVVVPHTGHAFAFPCVDDLVAAFVAKGSAKDLDASCVAAVARPPFLTEELLAAYGRQPATAAEPQEVWEGVLDVGVAKLRLVLEISKADDGKLSAVIDSPDQGAENLPVDTVARTGSSLHFEMAVINASYDGTTSADGSEISGTWKQGGRSWPLVFKRATKPMR